MESYHKMSDSKEGVVIHKQTYYNQTCTEKCCTCGKNNLTEEELESLNSLRARSRVSFVKENQLHLSMLKHLWELCFPSEEVPEDCKSSNWKTLGFQGNDPSTDFRGAGLFGLQQLIFIAENYPQEFSMIRKNAVDYSFAISALNVSVMFS